MDTVNMVIAGVNTFAALICFAAAAWGDNNKMLNLFLGLSNTGLAVMNFAFAGVLGG